MIELPKDIDPVVKEKYLKLVKEINKESQELFENPQTLEEQEK